MNRLIVCNTCKYDTGSAEQAATALADALAKAGLDQEFEVTDTGCMGGCEEPASLGLQGKDRATFLFSGLKFPDDTADVIKTCRAYLESRNGWIEDATGCGRLRHCLRARIPALPV